MAQRKRPPVVRAMIVCETIFVYAASRELSLVNITAHLYCDKFPIKIPKLAAYYAVTNTSPDPSFSLQVADVREQDKVVWESPEPVSAKVEGPLDSIVGLFYMNGISIPHEGKYAVQLLIDGEQAAEWPVAFHPLKHRVRPH